MQSISPDGLLSSIKVIGVGGGGCSALNHMLKAGLGGVEFIAVDADPQTLRLSKASQQVCLEEKARRGLDGHADPRKGAKAAEDSHDELSRAIQAADMVFIVAGMGGGTGTGAAPLVARLARQAGALTIGVVTRPFTFEGTRRMQKAEAGIINLKEHVDTLIVFSNDRLLKTINKRATLDEAFKAIDDILFQGVRGISDLLTVPDLICLELADIRTALSEGHLAQILIGRASGEERALVAARQAAYSCLMDFGLDEARGLIVNITAGPNLALIEVSQVIACLHASTRPNDNLLFGVLIDPHLGDEIHVTIIAHGYERMAVREPVRRFPDLEI
jgi:cell division protein FtsZ